MKQTSAKPDARDVAIKDSGGDAFEKDVIKASQKNPVIVAFWIDGCPLCAKTLPLLEQALKAKGEGFGAVKIDIGKNPSLIAQLIQEGLPFRIVPMIAAFYRGQVVTLLSGEQTQAQLDSFLADVLKKEKTGPGPTFELVLRGNALIANGEEVRAQKLFSLILDEDIHNVGAWNGLIRALIAVDDETAARAALKDVPKDILDAPEIKSVAMTLDLKKKGRAASENLEQTKARLSRNPHDHGAQFEMALLLNSADKKQEAVDLLIDILRSNKDWENGAAYNQLKEMFESWGSADRATLYGHRMLHDVLGSAV